MESPSIWEFWNWKTLKLYSGRIRSLLKTGELDIIRGRCWNNQGLEGIFEVTSRISDTQTVLTHMTVLRNNRHKNKLFALVLETFDLCRLWSTIIRLGTIVFCLRSLFSRPKNSFPLIGILRKCNQANKTPLWDFISTILSNCPLYTIVCPGIHIYSFQLHYQSFFARTT